MIFDGRKPNLPRDFVERRRDEIVREFRRNVRQTIQVVEAAQSILTTPKREPWLYEPPFVDDAPTERFEEAWREYRMRLETARHYIDLAHKELRELHAHPTTKVIIALNLYYQERDEEEEEEE